MAEHKDRLIQKLNEFRNDLARGQYSPLPQAARLTEVQWDDELAYVALMNAKQCIHEHDKCRVTHEYPYAGQNIFWSSGIRNETAVLEDAFNSWWNENKVTTASYIASYPIT